MQRLVWIMMVSLALVAGLVADPASAIVVRDEQNDFARSIVGQQFAIRERRPLQRHDFQDGLPGLGHADRS